MKCPELIFSRFKNVIYFGKKTFYIYEIICLWKIFYIYHGMPYLSISLFSKCPFYDFVIYELSFYNFIYLGKKSFSIYEITYLWKIFHFYDISYLNFLYKITPL